MAGENPSGWVRGAVWALGLGVPVVVGGVAVISGLDRERALERHESLAEHVHANDARLRGLSESVTRALEHVESHNTEANYWKTRIETNTDRITELTSNANARPDPFTGTQGRELERRIDQLERDLDQVERMRERLEELDDRQIRNEKYYRDSVVPMLNQSNALQMQRIQQGMNGESGE